MRDTSRPVPFARASRAVFDLALEGMVWSRRSLLMAALLGLPIVFAIVYRVVLAAHIPPRVTPFDLYGAVVVFYYLRNVLPLAALFYASALIADEFAAYVATTLSLALPAVVVTFFILLTSRGRVGLGGAVPDLLRDLGVLALALLAYGALFTLLGVLLKRPVIPGLL